MLWQDKAKTVLVYVTVPEGTRPTVRSYYIAPLLADFGPPEGSTDATGV